MEAFKVIAFMDPIAGVWLKPHGYTRESGYRDYVLPHRKTGGSIPELGVVEVGERIPDDADSYWFACEHCQYLVVGEPVRVS